MFLVWTSVHVPRLDFHLDFFDETRNTEHRDLDQIVLSEVRFTVIFWQILNLKIKFQWCQLSTDI